MPQFGSATFTNATTQMGEKFGSINDFKNLALSMTSNGEQSGALLAYPSAISGQSFTITSGYQEIQPNTQNQPVNATALNNLNNGS